MRKKILVTVAVLASIPVLLIALTVTKHLLRSHNLLPDPYADVPEVEQPTRFELDASQSATFLQAGPLPGSYPDSRSIAIDRMPYLQQVTTAGVTVMWQAAEPCRGLVEWTSGGVTGTSAVAPFQRRHTLRLEGLRRGNSRDVSYRVHCIAPENATFNRGDPPPRASWVGDRTSFKLTATDTEPYQFAVYGDNRLEIANHERVIQAMMPFRPDALFSTGDLVTHGQVYGRWDAEFFRPAAPVLAFAPLFVAIGNHEEDARHFYELLSQPPPEDYFAINYGPDLHIILNSAKTSSLKPGGAQHTWFVELLDSERFRTARWVFAYIHHPPDHSTRPSLAVDPTVRDVVAPLAEAYGIDLFFTGHAHYYERGERAGVTWVITGGGGTGLDRKIRDVDFLVVSQRRHHFVLVEPLADRIDVVAVDIEGELFDRFTVNPNRARDGN